MKPKVTGYSWTPWLRQTYGFKMRSYSTIETPKCIQKVLLSSVDLFLTWMDDKIQTYLRFQDFCVHAVIGLEYLLCFLLSSKLEDLKLHFSDTHTSHKRHMIHTYWLSCFQRWKKSCEVISVGWKNLLIVTGSFRVRFCRAPPYLRNTFFFFQNECQSLIALKTP